MKYEHWLIAMRTENEARVLRNLKGSGYGNHSNQND